MNRINNEGITLPCVSNNCKHIFLKFVIKINEAELGLSRSDLLKIFRSNGIDLEIPYQNIKGYYNNYKKIEGDNNFPVTKELIDSIICLPVHPFLCEKNLRDIVSVFENEV